MPTPVPMTRTRSRNDRDKQASGGGGANGEDHHVVQWMTSSGHSAGHRGGHDPHTASQSCDMHVMCNYVHVHGCTCIMTASVEFDSQLYELTFCVCVCVCVCVQVVEVVEGGSGTHGPPRTCSGSAAAPDPARERGTPPRPRTPTLSLPAADTNQASASSACLVTHSLTVHTTFVRT